jgi:hypothetical protein
MLAHYSVSMQWTVGEVVARKGIATRTSDGAAGEAMVFRNEDPLRKNSPTAKSLIMEDERDLGKERERLSGLIDKFAAGGAAGCTKNPHSFFGKMTPEEWAILMHKHLDHHLRQFGVRRSQKRLMLGPRSGQLKHRVLGLRLVLAPRWPSAHHRLSHPCWRSHNGASNPKPVRNATAKSRTWQVQLSRSDIRPTRWTDRIVSRPEPAQGSVFL